MNAPPFLDCVNSLFPQFENCCRIKVSVMPQKNLLTFQWCHRCVEPLKLILQTHMIILNKFIWI